MRDLFERIVSSHDAITIADITQEYRILWKSARVETCLPMYAHNDVGITLCTDEMSAPFGPAIHLTWDSILGIKRIDDHNVVIVIQAP